MFNGKRVLAIVPARGGSKRLPEKNISLVAGKSLLAWTLEAAVGSALIDRIVLSTEDESVAVVGRESGFTDIVMRPKRLAGDDTSMTSVIEHVVQMVCDQGDEFDYLLLLQPTSPLRTARHIDEAFSIVETKNMVGAVSVCRTEHPLEWMGKLNNDGILDSFFRETRLEDQSQAFNLAYQINGAIYIVPIERFLEEKTLFLSTGMVAYVMDRKDSVDIDDAYDLRLADWLIRQREKRA